MTQRERVKEIRKTLGLTLEKFGEKVGVTKQTVSRIENGVNNLTEQMIKSICREYNINEEWLRNGTGEMFNEPSDEVAEIVSEILENPDSKFYQLVLAFVRTYSDLSPNSQEIIDKYIQDLLQNIKKTSQNSV